MLQKPDAVMKDGHTLYFDHSGPMIRYVRDAFGETFEVDDLNPENHIHFAMTPWELFVFGWKCLWAAVRPD